MPGLQRGDGGWNRRKTLPWELTGTTVERFIDWSTKLDMIMRVNEFKRHVPSSGRATMRLRRKDGSWIWLDLGASVMNFGQNPEKYLVKFQVIETGVREAVRRRT